MSTINHKLHLLNMLDILHTYSAILYAIDNTFAGISSVKEIAHLSSLKSKCFRQVTLFPIKQPSLLSVLERIPKRKILLLFIVLLPNL